MIHGGLLRWIAVVAVLRPNLYSGLSELNWDSRLRPPAPDGTEGERLIWEPYRWPRERMALW
jgi:hypothetical protein